MPEPVDTRSCCLASVVHPTHTLPSKVFCLVPCNQFQSATDELSVAIVDWTS